MKFLFRALKDLEVSIYPAPINPAGQEGEKKKHVQSEDKCYLHLYILVERCVTGPQYKYCSFVWSERDALNVFP